MSQSNKSPESRGARMELIDEGFIAVAAGCEVHHGGKAVFRPRGEMVEVRVENSEGYFQADPGRWSPIKDFEILLGAERVEAFFLKIKRLLDHPGNLINLAALARRRFMYPCLLKLEKWKQHWKKTTTLLPKSTLYWVRYRSS